MASAKRREFESVPICPFCGHEDREWWDWLYLESDADGHEEETECESCEKTFRIVVHIDIKFSTYADKKGTK